MVRILALSPWDLMGRHHGGSVRFERLVSSLTTHFDVSVIQPNFSGDALVDGVSGMAVHYGERISNRRHDALGVMPTVGKSVYRSIRSALENQISEGHVSALLVGDSHLAAMVLNIDMPLIVDFANIEADRYRSSARNQPTARLIARDRIEYVKALIWEPRVAKSANIAIGLTTEDTLALKSRGARCAITVPNAFVAPPAFRASPAEGPLVTVGSWWYGPNRAGLERLLHEQWPKIRTRFPGCELFVVGAGSEGFDNADIGVRGVGYVNDLGDFYRRGIAVLAPAESGAGSQLKVAEALAHGRVVIGPEFLLRERRPGLPSLALMASDDLCGIIAALADVEHRHAIEREIDGFVRANGWATTVLPLISEVRKLCR